MRRGTLGFARLRESENKIAVMRDLSYLQYAVLTVLACVIAGDSCKKVWYCGIDLALRDAGKNFHL